MNVRPCRSRRCHGDRADSHWQHLRRVRRPRRYRGVTDGSTGLFSFDTRHLSRWILTLDDQRLTALSTDDLQYFESRFFLVPGTGTVYIDAKQTVIRRRQVADGFHEELTVLNHSNEPIDVKVGIEAASDFADLFEVKDALAKKGSYSTEVVDGSLRLMYRRDTFSRATIISASEPCEMDDDGLTFQIHIEPHSAWKTDIKVSMTVFGTGEDEAASGSALAWQVPGPRTDLAEDLRRWMDASPRLACEWEPLLRSYRRSLIDLAALRFSPISAGGSS